MPSRISNIAAQTDKTTKIFSSIMALTEEMAEVTTRALSIDASSIPQLKSGDFEPGPSTEDGIRRRARVSHFSTYSVDDGSNYDAMSIEFDYDIVPSPLKIPLPDMTGTAQSVPQRREHTHEMSDETFCDSANGLQSKGQRNRRGSGNVLGQQWWHRKTHTVCYSANSLVFELEILLC